VGLFPLLSVGGVPGGRNDAYDPSGFDVSEHFREPEVRGQHNHSFLFRVSRLIGVHLFWFGLFSGAVRRAASPPAGVGRGWLRGVVVNVHVHGGCVPIRVGARSVHVHTGDYPP
jgi:hypothetical protein